MADQFQTGTVIFRQWDSKGGLTEISRSFQTANELFLLCIQAEPALLIDRVVLNGADSGGAPRIVTLVFQSASTQDKDKGG